MVLNHLNSRKLGYFLDALYFIDVNVSFLYFLIELILNNKNTTLSQCFFFNQKKLYSLKNKGTRDTT